MAARGLLECATGASPGPSCVRGRAGTVAGEPVNPVKDKELASAALDIYLGHLANWIFSDQRLRCRAVAAMARLGAQSSDHGEDRLVRVRRLSSETLLQILKYAWRPPILRALKDGPRRYTDIRADLIEQQGHTPGDGYISTELRELRDLGLIEQCDLEGSRRRAWTLTGLGHAAVVVIDTVDDPSSADVDPQGRPGDSATEASTSEPRDDHEGGSAGRRRSLIVDPEKRPATLDVGVPHPARRYNYWLGGKDNFRADRESGDAIARVFPSIRTAARENRAFMQRAVRFLAHEEGVRQFLDIGTGLPTADNVHQVAQSIDERSRVVYVDNDPLVITHARALLNSSAVGRTAYIEADIRDPDAILHDPAVSDTLDFSAPIALMIVAVMHFIPDEDEPYGVVKRLVDALPTGSYLVLSHATFDPLDPDTITALNKANAGSMPPFCPRTADEVARYFHGLELVEPGIVSVSDWRPITDSRPAPAEAAGYGAVARKRGRP